MALAVLGLACAVWSLGYALEIAGADLATKIFWGKSQYLGIVAVPILWVMFAYSYTTQTRMTKRNIILLSIVPFITLLLALTIEYHRLIWMNVRILTAGTFSALEVTHGFWFWIYWIYSNILLALGTVYIIRSFGRTAGLLRRQNLILLVAVLVPWIGNVLYVTDISPIPSLDITPFAFTISIVVFTWGIFRLKLVNLAPVARETVVEKMRDGMLVLDANTNIVDINPAMQQALGLPASQVIGQKASDVFNDMPAMVKRYENILETQDEIVIGKGEAQVWYELHMSPLFDNRDRLLGRVLTIRNITERKQAEERVRQMNAELERRVIERTSELQETNAYLTSLIETSIALNESLDLNEVLDRILVQAHKLVPAQAINIMFVEGEYARIVRRVGYLGLEKIEQKLQEFHFPISWPTFHEMHTTHKSIFISDTTREAGWQKIQDAEWVRSLIGVPLVISDETIGFLNASDSQPDFFDRKHLLMLESLAHHASVAIQNARLLGELKNALEKEQGMRDQLVQADKLAALGKMVSVIAHEINNPIQTVKNTFYLLEDQILPGGPAVEYLKMGSAEANRIADLVAQLRGTYASGSMALVPVDVAGLLVEVRELLAPQLKKNQVEWCQADAVPPYTVFAVRNNLKQVFINLCLNALEAMEADQGGRLTIGMHAGEDGRRVGIDFHNTGSPISAQALPFIFDPFFTTKKNGTGLGLSISYDIIRRHQGEILVESAPGKGVTFTVWLPLAPAGQEEAAL
jgi:PAS domain S-box-containing protein